MEFADLLAKQGIGLSEVLVLRHCPPEAGLSNKLLYIAEEKPEVFNAYQRAQSETVERLMQKADYVASFIGFEAGRAVFVGLFKVAGSRQVDTRDYWESAEYKYLRQHGLKGVNKDRVSALWFDLVRVDFYNSWKGKLIVIWPRPEIRWFRWVDKTSFPVAAILRDSMLVDKTPQWDEVSMTWPELHELPHRVKAALETWRGVYYIFDASDGKGYVGSAYGGDNLLGRWRAYAKSGHGGNKLLRERDPKNFIFSILQRLESDATPETVIRLEDSWKRRLQTKTYGLNAN